MWYPSRRDLMQRLSVLAVIAFFIFSCSGSLKEGYDAEVDQDWDVLESMNYLQEGGNVLGEGESVEGLLKFFAEKPLSPVNYDLVPEDSNV